MDKKISCWNFHISGNTWEQIKDTKFRNAISIFEIVFTRDLTNKLILWSLGSTISNWHFYPLNFTSLESRSQWAFLIEWCQSVVNVSHFRLLQNHCLPSHQTYNKCSYRELVEVLYFFEKNLFEIQDVHSGLRLTETFPTSSELTRNYW